MESEEERQQNVNKFLETWYNVSRSKLKGKLMKKELYISLSGPESRGAPYPPFDEKQVNESKFEDCVRAKSWSICAKGDDGYVSWISQETDYPTEAWENEVKRAFKANGFEGTVHVRFGSRMKGIHLEYDLQVN